LDQRPKSVASLEGKISVVSFPAFALGGLLTGVSDSEGSFWQETKTIKQITTNHFADKILVNDIMTDNFLFLIRRSGVRNFF
jgi:hypothetical protein